MKSVFQEKFDVGQPRDIALNLDKQFRVYRADFFFPCLLKLIERMLRPTSDSNAVVSYLSAVQALVAHTTASFALLRVWLSRSKYLYLIANTRKFL